MAQVLRIKLREVVREDRGGTYGVSVQAAPSHFPGERYRLTVSFGSAPERVPELTAVVFEQLDSLKTFGTTLKYLTKVKETQRRERETSLKENSFWLSILETYDYHGEDFLDILKYDELVDGFLLVVSSTGLGHTYAIAGNKYISGDTVVDIKLYEEIRVATVAGSTVMSFVKNRWRDVIVCASTPAGSLVGVSPHVIAVNYYGWLQTKGPCGVIVDTGESILIGCEVGMPTSSAVDGACGVAHIAEGIWGKCLGVEAAAGTALIDLALE